MKEFGYVLFGIYALLTGWLLLNSILQWHLWRRARKAKPVAPPLPQGPLPFVTVQVPVYNEKYVVEGLLDCLGKLHYPKDLFEVLVLDDSTDETGYLLAQKLAFLQAQGINAKRINRTNRTGYKAGALQQSIGQCRGELIAIFDADFRPAPDFLLRLVPHFANPAVGIVQSRWAHLNRGQNFLTRVQSYLLDTYFTVEQAGRQQAGYFSNFCGTAGLWRKQCIVDAGGWDGNVLSEDLDLSYRAQLRGWKMVYDAGTAVPAELPATVEAFKVQQARWTKGIIQTFCKNGKSLLKAPLQPAKKFHAFFHLLSSLVFPCLFINSFLALPLLLLRQVYPEFIALTNFAAIGGVNLILLTAIFYRGVKSTGGDDRFTLYYPVFLVVYMALSVQNTVGVVQGLLGRRSAFVRTPKFAGRTADESTYKGDAKGKTVLLELAMLIFYSAAAAISIVVGDFFFLLLFVMMGSGLAILLAPRLAGWLRWPFAGHGLRRRLSFLLSYQQSGNRQATGNQQPLA